MADHQSTIAAARAAAAAMNPDQQPQGNRATRRREQMAAWRQIRRRGRAMAVEQARIERRGFGS